jgi:hypothetical protein
MKIRKPAGMLVIGTFRLGERTEKTLKPEMLSAAPSTNLLPF